MSRLGNAGPSRSFVFRPGCRSSQSGNFLTFRGKLLCASSSRRPSGARSLLEKTAKRSTQLFRCRSRRKSTRPFRTPDISSARRRYVRKDGNSIAPCDGGMSERRYNWDNCALHRSCCRGVRWKSRADSKTESSARVFRGGPQSPATISRKGSARSFLFAVPIEDRQFVSAASVGYPHAE